MSATLQADALVEAAQRQTGLERFDSDSWREGLDVLLADVAAHPKTARGMATLEAAFTKAIATRLLTTDYLRAHPELESRPIERPVFVFGIPRTGTTLLNNLLAADPARRSPLSWEIEEPVPPATADTLKTDPRALAKLEAERRMFAARPDLAKYYRGSAIYPNEDVFIMANDFKTLAWESRGKLPGYREWIFSTDVTSAYAYHKSFLQVLQAQAPGVWNLKMPSHTLYLPTLLKVYPDARLIWTHRDPYAATGSLCSLIAMSHGAFEAEVDKAYIGEDCAWQTVEHAERAMDARASLGEDRVIDVHYADLLADPIGAMRRLYAALGDPFTEEAEAGMQAWLDDNPQDKFGRHAYRLGDFGLSVEQLAPRFERYLSRHPVQMEG